MTGNPFVEFMRTYGPSPSSDSMYDEHVQSALEKYQVAPIELSAPLVKELGALLTGSNPTNVILTGTAGDGKTYHIRQVFLKYLGGREGDWPGTDLVIKYSRPDGREIRIVRDLSELSQQAKDAELKHITECLLGEDEKTLYLLAANDGQLLEMWRTASQQGEHAQSLRDVHDTLATMMQSETETDSSGLLQVRMYNLSRMTQPSIIKEVIEKLLKHPMWDTGCEKCPLNEQGARCAIRINRQLLLGEIDNRHRSLFRSRLRDLLELASADDQHIPVRQILTLVANIVLGDSKNYDDPLLTCERAKEYALRNQYQNTNPYDNVVGENLTEDVRRRFVVFSTLETFGIGYETTNTFDDLLLHHRPSDVIENLESVDSTYGVAIFQAMRNSYVNGISSRMPLRDFSRAMVSQRRRLFFNLPSSSYEESRNSHWKLTVFHHGQHYLNYRNFVKNGNSHTVVDRMERQLVKGLNRTLTGMMTEETEKLWLASMVGTSDDPTGRISVTPEIDRIARRGIVHLEVSYNKRRDWPELNLALLYPVEGLKDVVGFEIRPQIFEYLLRVADGSLPSSFSRQCHQEVKHFAVMLRQFLQRLSPVKRLTLESVRVLSLDADALIKESLIKVNDHDC